MNEPCCCMLLQNFSGGTTEKNAGSHCPKLLTDLTGVLTLGQYKLLLILFMIMSDA